MVTLDQASARAIGTAIQNGISVTGLGGEFAVGILVAVTNPNDSRGEMPEPF